MENELTIQQLLQNTGLGHEYQRMAVLDSRIPEALERLLPFATHCEPGVEEPLVLRTLRDATQEARDHFKRSDPEIASVLASSTYLKALTDLHKHLSNGKSRNL